VAPPDRSRGPIALTAGPRVVCERCAVAATAWTRLRGLLGRAALTRGEGLLISPAHSIHTCFMRHPIDAVFLDEALTVVAVAPRLAPWRVRGERRARTVLELAAGECERLGLREGHRLGVDDRAAAARVGRPRQGA